MTSLRQSMALVSSLTTVLLAWTPAAASPVTIVLSVNPTSKFDYITGTYSAFSQPGIVVVTFENTRTSLNDFGTTTISNFMGGTTFSSPYTSSFPADPYGRGPAAAYDYTFPNVSDYSSTFIEQFAAQGNTYSAGSGPAYSYHIELRIDRRSASRGGTGAADYAFTETDNLSFLQDAELNPNRYSFLFDEYAYGFDRTTSKYVYGSDIAVYNASILSISYAATNVPEPVSAGLLGMGVAASMLVGLRRSDKVSPRDVV